MASEMDFLEKYIKSHKVSKDTLDHFAAIPWTKAYLENPDYEAIPTYSRTSKSTNEDYFFARTVNTPTTIPYAVSMRLKTLKTLDETPRTVGAASTLNHKDVTQVPEKPDCVFLFDLGSPGLDGHPGVLHGGMVCAILDEMLGICAMLHHQNIEKGARSQIFTVNLNTTYRAPVPTGEDIMIRCWLTSRQGRKLSLVGQIVDKTGKVLSEAICTYVIAKPVQKL